MGGRPSERWLIYGLLAILVVSLVFPSTRWFVSNSEDVKGDYLTWGDDATHFYVSGTNYVERVRQVSSGFITEAIFSYPLADGVWRGPIDYDRGWLYFSANSNLVAFNASRLGRDDAPTPLALAHLLGAPVAVFRILVEGTDVYLAGKFVDPPYEGFMAALRISDPAAIGRDSVQLLLKLTFPSGVSDFAARPGMIFVFEENGSLHLFDVTTLPPEWYATHRIGDSITDSDLVGDLLSVSCGRASRYVRFFRVSGTNLTLLSTVSVAGIPVQVSLESGRAFVNWHPLERQKAFAIIDVSSPETPRILGSFVIDDLGSAHLVNLGVAYVLGTRWLSIVAEGVVPAFVTGELLPASIAVAAALITFKTVPFFLAKSVSTARQPPAEGRQSPLSRQNQR